jgi:hypothetical protein
VSYKARETTTLNNMKKGTKKQNNRHGVGKGNGKFGKKSERIARSAEREPRSLEQKLATAGARETKKLLAA